MFKKGGVSRGQSKAFVSSGEENLIEGKKACSKEAARLNCLSLFTLEPRHNTHSVITQAAPMAQYEYPRFYGWQKPP